MADILIIILNWRQPELTLECIFALHEMDQIDRCDILVIDNGSGDHSADYLSAHGERFELLSLKENIGFGRGNNVGMRLALERGYRYALLLNNDAFAENEMLTHLLAEAAPDIGLLAPKIYFDHDRKMIWYFKGRMQAGTLNLRDSGEGERDNGQFSESQDCDYLLGTCLLVNLEAARAQQVGLFDEQFFMYYEDLDWSIRMRTQGYRLRVVAPAHLYHRVAASSGGNDSPMRTYYAAKHAVIFYRKHYRKGNLAIMTLYRLGNGVRVIWRGVRSRRPAIIRAYLRGMWEGLTAQL